MALITESKNAPLWKSAVVASLDGGKTAKIAISEADQVVLAYEARFSLSLPESRLGSTLLLENALAYFERSALTGLTVMLLGYIDSPPMGVIKDFSTQGVLIKWTTGNPLEGLPKMQAEQWIGIECLQLVMPIT